MEIGGEDIFFKGTFSRLLSLQEKRHDSEEISASDTSILGLLCVLQCEPRTNTMLRSNRDVALF